VVGASGAASGRSRAPAERSVLAALDREIGATDEPAQRKRLERFRDSAVDVGRGTLTQVLAHIVKGGL
jgi:hypothetical protein